MRVDRQTDGRDRQTDRPDQRALAFMASMARSKSSSSPSTTASRRARFSGCSNASACDPEPSSSTHPLRDDLRLLDLVVVVICGRTRLGRTGGRFRKRRFEVVAVGTALRLLRLVLVVGRRRRLALLAAFLGRGLDGLGRRQAEERRLPRTAGALRRRRGRFAWTYVSVTVTCAASSDAPLPFLPAVGTPSTRSKKLLLFFRPCSARAETWAADGAALALAAERDAAVFLNGLTDTAGREAVMGAGAIDCGSLSSSSSIGAAAAIGLSTSALSSSSRKVIGSSSSSSTSTATGAATTGRRTDDSSASSSSASDDPSPESSARSRFACCCRCCCC